MLYAAQSHVGLVRQTNQDVFELSDIPATHQYMIVADGMGGASAGDVASRMAVDTVATGLKQALQDHRTEDIPEVLREAVLEANRKVWESSQTHEEYFGMGTTMVAAMFDGNEVVFAHVGDSRGYILMAGSLQQVTSDHSLVAELVRRGQLTPDEAVHHPQRNIVTRSLGTDSQSIVDIDVLKWKEGDVVLLCSDGLTNLVGKEELEHTLFPLQIATTNVEVENVVQKLLQMALHRGAPDNVTIAIAVHNGSMRSEDA
ncbi:Stp1/IreP family PP2C-type Ser/Thr phosphatase [Alicyclobacillus sp. SO9]|uniref:Stp1/IreP family PP2C-type Ser/Thr phosphatase n=1 Tax=Alicyclobacillus sp. SO9 TaxID=2665646 RepID=UPI0018E88E33|nr:Stp1/IreP family PP2C-type Ser/Thr phosphatase [Alicyclobacillus sp. SO9]QQE80740.1 Stp1/IreP family PP2C-type Ser/Thr phosphatase [Alicyclobacillus sp. SO9]